MDSYGLNRKKSTALDRKGLNNTGADRNRLKDKLKRTEKD